MTELLYLNNSYLKEFRAKVVKSISNSEKNKNYVVLNKSAFYPEGGGQPSDTGFLKFNGNRVEVLKVKKKEEVLHKIKEKIEKGKEVVGEINWNKRYTYMKMHTAQHLLSRLVLNDFGARVVGNQIHKDFSRIDFYPIKFSQQDLQELEEKANKLISEKIPVKIYTMARKEIEKTNEGRANLELIPKHIDPLRVVEIQNFDVCPCGGTHVSNIKEIGQIKILGKENKGKEKERLIFSIS